MLNKIISLSAIFAIGLQLGGCYAEYGPVVTDSVPVAPLNVASRLQTGDQLKIIVFGEEALSGIYDISPAGTVSMPLIPPIVAVGRTRAEVESAITRAYAGGKILQEPKVTVSVVTYRPVYVFGEVTRPSAVVYASGLDVLSAVAAAGGFTYRASRDTVLIRHSGEQVWQRYSLAAPLALEPGDVVRIPERYF